MASDPFNAVGGYKVGIPPIPVIDQLGTITAPSARLGNINITGDAIVYGNVQSSLFLGSFHGNITGALGVPGGNNYVIFNEGGNAQADAGFQFDSTQQLVTITGDLVANSITIGSGANKFVTQRVLNAITNSRVVDQVLHSTVANTIASIDYTVIATDADGGYRQTTKLFGSVYGTDVGYFETGTIDVPLVSPGVGDFKVQYDNGQVNLTVTPLTANTVTYKIMITSYKE